ncbi:MAG: HAD-IIB family hydrolase, partial [Eubacteriales bacterium]|nr:HAD-IIB family hydrolase [Eubacteriales bacterium]
MKTLYISDLDGTLLNQNAELSEYTAAALNRLIETGVHFSVATARTAATSVLMLENVAINVPIVLMNGVLIYDMQEKRYIKRELLSKEKTAKILTAMKITGQIGLMYALDGDELVTYYERIYSDALQDFIDERVQKYNKKFVQIHDFADADTDVIYFCYMDICENINRLYAALESISGLRIEKYQDIYSGGDLWYMEVFSDTASKYNAVQFLREQYGFDKIIGFGDNLNDLPLFAACDECYAVANAKPEVKEKATAVIGANTEDGAVKWMEENEMKITIKKLTPDLAEDYVHFFDETPHWDNVDEHKCYCVCWASTDHNKEIKEDGGTVKGRREIAKRYVKEGFIQGYLAYKNGKIVGWCNANTKANCLHSYSWEHFMQSVHTNGSDPDIKIKSVFCFVIAPEMQRKGIATK